jgi:hypothetical protein
MYRSQKFFGRQNYATYIPTGKIGSAIPRAFTYPFNNQFQTIEDTILSTIADFLDSKVSGNDTLKKLSDIETELIQLCATVANTPNCC